MTRFAPIRVPVRVAALILLAGLAWFAGPDRSVAQDTSKPVQDAPPPVPDDGRYTFHRRGEGFVRLDSRTGQMALCGWSATTWSCQMVADERVALEGEIARLQRDNAELKKSLLSRGLELPRGVMAEAPAPGPIPPANVPDSSAKEPKAPSEAELDRAFTFMKNVWRRLVDLMVDWQRDMQRKG
jgi:hypothetical protein